MNAKELKLGDIVSCYNKYVVVKTLGVDLCGFVFHGYDILKRYHNLEPIKLTVELLSKFGFVKKEEHSRTYRNIICGNTIDITDLYESSSKKWTIHIDDEWFMNLFYWEINYLHELQHIVYDVCGKELEIK